jgi:MFS family permease
VRNRSFVVNTLAMAAMTFAIGGLAQWVPSFLNRVHGLDVARANILFGGITVLAGIIGTVSGGWLGDRYQQRSPRGYLLVSGAGFLLGAPLAAAAILAPSTPLCLALIFCAETFLFLNTGPLNTVIVNVVGPGARSMAFAVNIFCIHALGDAVSPTIIGWLSDRWGLRAGLLLTPLMILLAALFCLLCGRYIERDTARAEGAGGPPTQ